MVNITPKKRKKIYGLIGKEGIQEIAKKFEVTENYVYMIIRGERKNLNILEMVLKLAGEKSQKLDKKLEKINSLTKKI